MTFEVFMAILGIIGSIVLGSIGVSIMITFFLFLAFGKGKKTVGRDAAFMIFGFILSSMSFMAGWAALGVLEVI